MPRRVVRPSLLLVIGIRSRDEGSHMNDYTSGRFARDRYNQLRAEASGDLRVQMAEEAASSARSRTEAGQAADRIGAGSAMVATLFTLVRTSRLTIGAGWRRATGRSG